MTSSGTISQTTIEVAQIIEHAFRRAGISPAEATIDSLNAAKENLYFYLSALSNDGVNLWTIEKVLSGLYVGRANYEVGIGAIDLKNVLRRSLNLPSGGVAASSAGGSADYAFDKSLTTACTQTSINGNISYQFDSNRLITTVGFMPNGDQTLAPIFEWSNDGATWTELYSVDRTAFDGGQWYYWDISRPASAQYYRMRETSGGTLNIIELVFATTLMEIPLGRISLDQYTNLTDKTMRSQQPLEYWFDRKVDNPEINVWPVPNYSFDMLVFWRNRQIQDVGDLSNTLEIPQRWIEAAVTELAVRMLLELPGEVKQERYDILKKEASAATFRAQQEERDRSPIFIAPNISCYTR